MEHKTLTTKPYTDAVWFVRCCYHATSYGNLDVLLPTITIIINTSLVSGVVPPDLKTAIDNPLLKKKKKSLPGKNVLKNYRPISNLPFLSKILEEVVLQQLLAHIQENNFCNPFQSAPRHQHCTPLPQQLHWLPISERIRYKTACICYNLITGSIPSYLSELLQLYSPSRSLRSSPDTRITKLRRFNRKTHGFHSLSYFGPHIWSNLPQDVRHSATLPSFKNKLKTFVFSEHFN